MLFFFEPEAKSQWTVLVEYLTISTNVSCCQTCCRLQIIVFQQHMSRMNQRQARNTVQQLLRKTLNFISPEL